MTLRQESQEVTAPNTNSDFLSLFGTSAFDDIDLEYLDAINFTPPTHKLVSTTTGTSALMNEDTRRNLKRIQDKTIQLERERRDIQFKLESLKASNTSSALPVQSNQSINRILSELREQQRINEAALTMLKGRLVDEQPLYSMPYSSSTGNINRLAGGAQINPYSNVGLNTLPPIFNVDYASMMPGINNVNDVSLQPEEIRAARFNYLQSGGHDQNVLNRFTEMEYNSRYKQTNNARIPQQSTPSKYDPLAIELDNKIRKVDQDNKRLQAELERLQNQMITNDNTNSNRNILPPIDASYNQTRIKYVPVQDSIPNLIMNSSQRSLQQQQPDFRSPQHNNNNNNNNNYSNNNNNNYSPRQANTLQRLKDLPASQYDPSGGFVIFVDFVTNIDPSYACARVITCLHHPKSGLGEPSVLPIVSTEPMNDNGNSRTAVALISTKQPVPRCPPQQPLTILIELQMATTSNNNNNNETRLKSCAWTKLPLFDSKNRLLSGRWKSQLRNLPIRSDANLSALSGLPEFGYSEIFYRLVNIRDSDEQTNTPISTSYASQYQPTVQDQ